MTTRGEINSNFYQIVNVDANGAPTSVKPQYITGGNVDHANVADVANSVSVANVVGIGNIAVINLTGSSSNVLYGNGVWAPAGSGGDANYANFAGTAFNVSGSNVTGTVGNATHATVADSANSVTAANIVGTVNLANYATVANSVAVANVAGIGNIATINLSGNGSQLLAGNGTWIATPNTAVANFANYAGNVTVSAQPNITSLGNLINLQFDTTVTPITANPGQMFWDTGEHTISLGMENGVTQQIGLESYVYVKASSAITNGQVVMFTGANGDNILAAPANASSSGFKPEYIIGIATQSIALNAFGYITVFGKVHDLNTLAYTVGDILWYDPTSTTGGLTNVQPTDPAVQVQMAAVTKKAGGDGHIQVRVDVLATLSELTDVTITSATVGQALVYSGGNVWVNGIPNIANIAYSVSGSNVSGQVANALVAGTVYTNSQPNITSVGTLTSLSVTGNITSGNASLGNLVTGNYFSGNGSLLTGITSTTGNANYANYAGNAFSVTGSNVSGQVANALIAGTVYTNAQPNITSVGTLTILSSSGNITAPRFISNIATGNAPFVVSSTTPVNNLRVNGQQPNITALNNSGVTVYNSSTVSATARYLLLTSSQNIDDKLETAVGITANASNSSITATTFVGTLSGTATSATTAGTVTTAAQPNITSVGTLTSLSVTGNITSGNATLGNLVTGNYFSGNGSLLTGVTASSATTAVTVTGNAQPNITSVGTLTSLSVTGNITSGNINGGNLITGNYHSGNGSLLSSITGANVTGTVANATYAVSAGSATTAGTVTINAQPNITSVGTLTSLSVTGNITSGNASLGNLVTGNYFSGNGSLLTSLTGANVSGAVAYATTANSVAVANVVGIGNIATTNYNGNGSQVLAGNGAWVAQSGGGGTPGGSNTYVQFNDGGTFGGNSQFTYDKVTDLLTIGNISANGALLTSINGSNVTGQVANALVAGTVYTNAQPNITSVGTLSSLSVTGNITSGNATLGNLVTGNYFSGNGSLLTGVTATATPAGSNTQVQFNDAGSLGANANLTFNKTTGWLSTLTLNLSGNIFMAGGNITNLGGILTTGTANLGTVNALTTNLTKFTETLPASANTSTSIAPDLANGTIVKYTANASFSFNGYTNPVAGQSGTIIITQDGTGGRTMTSTMKFSGGSKTLSTAAGAIDIISTFYDGSTYYAVLSKGFV